MCDNRHTLIDEENIMSKVFIEDFLKFNNPDSNHDDFYFLSLPRRIAGKSWTQIQSLKERPKVEVGKINFYFDDLWYKQTNSYVLVVNRVEWLKLS